MTKLRHHSARFATHDGVFEPGEVFDIPDPKDVEHLVKNRGCEIVEEPKPWAEPEVAIFVEATKDDVDDAMKIVTDAADDALEAMVERAKPIKTSPGWWLWEGKKYRLAKLPVEAVALLE